MLNNWEYKKAQKDSTSKEDSPAIPKGTAGYNEEMPSFKIFANDKFTPLYHFWDQCKNNNFCLVKKVRERYSSGIDKEEFKFLREQIMALEDPLEQATFFFYFEPHFF